MTDTIRKASSDGNRVFDNIVNEFFHFPQDNSWWLPITLFLAKEERLTVENAEIRVSYEDSYELKSIVESICPTYPMMEFRGESRSSSAKYQFLLARIAQELIVLGKDWYDQCFKDAYSRVLERITAYEGRRSGEYVQPKELTQLAVKMLQYNGGSVYNPFAGLCSYAIALGRGTEFVAQEISNYTFNLARFNLLANGIDSVRLFQEDSMLGFHHSDYIITTPPFGLRNADHPYRSSDAFVLEKVAVSANKRGVVILPYSVLYRSAFELPMVREELVERDLIDSIIALPSDIMRVSAIPLVMIVTDRNKSEKGIVRMINATHCYIPERGGNLLDLEKVYSILENPNSKHITYVSNTEIKACGFDLRLSRYIQPDIQVPAGYHLQSLSDIIEVKSLRRSSPEDEVPVIYLSNEVSHIGSVLTSRDGRITRGGTYIIDEDMLLVSANHSQIRSAWYDSSKGFASISSPGHFAFSIKDPFIDKSYLMMELGKDYVRYQLGVNQTTYSIEDILRLKILVPSLDVQHEEVIKAQNQFIQDNGIQLHELQTKQYQDFVRAMRTRKHAIGQVMNQVLPSINTIVKFINEHDYKDDVVGMRSGKTLGDYTIALQHNLSRMSDMINQFTREISFPEAEDLCIEDVLIEYIADHLGEGYTIDLDIDKKGEKHCVRIAKSPFIQMLDNVCDNARRSGFTDMAMLENRAYRIRISCDIDSTDSSNLRLLIANNGDPLSPKITPESVFAWGEGERTGIGGFEIAMIASHYGGSVQLRRYENDAAGFTVGYEIVLPLADHTEYEQ